MRADELSGGEIAVENPSDIETVLRELWRASEEGGEGSSSVIRSCQGNLIAFTLEERAQAVSATLADLSRERPSRIMLIAYDAKNQEQFPRAFVGTLCHLTAPGEAQVCCEMIHIRCGPNALEHLPGMVRPLLEPDLCTALWWDAPFRGHEESFTPLAQEANTIIVDSATEQPGPLTFSALFEQKVYLDLAWTRTHQWRRALARIYEDLILRPALSCIKSATFESAAQSNGTIGPSALYLAGWLAGQLGWKIIRKIEKRDGEMFALARGKCGDVDLHFIESEFPMSGMHIISDGPSVTEVELRLIAGGERLEERITVAESCPLPRATALECPNTARELGYLLEKQSPDAIFQRALHKACAIIEGEES